MKASPDVSVVMGVHNGGQYLDETISSVLSQDDVNLEFIIVDDGSDAESAAILKRRADSDGRITLIREPQGGLTRALIAGCQLAKGRYIARQDNGDWSLPGRLAAQMRALDKHADLAFVSCWNECCGPAGEFLSMSKGTGIACEPTNICSPQSPNCVLDGPSHHSSVMMRRECYENVGGYRSQFYFAQDWDLWYRLAEIGLFQMLTEPLHRSRIMPNSLSGRHREEQEMIVKLSRMSLHRRRHGMSDDDVLNAAAAIRPGKQRPISRLLRARGLYFIGEQLRRNGDVRRAKSYLLQSVSTYPPYWRPWVRLSQVYLRGILPD